MAKKKKGIGSKVNWGSLGKTQGSRKKKKTPGSFGQERPENWLTPEGHNIGGERKGKRMGGYKKQRKKRFLGRMPKVLSTAGSRHEPGKNPPPFRRTGGRGTGGTCKSRKLEKQRFHNLASSTTKPGPRRPKGVGKNAGGSPPKGEKRKRTMFRWSGGGGFFNFTLGLKRERATIQKKKKKPRKAKGKRGAKAPYDAP